MGKKRTLLVAIVKILQRKKTDRMCIHTEKYLLQKKKKYLLQGISKSKICRVGLWTEDPGEPMFLSESEGCLLQTEEELIFQMKFKDHLLEKSLLLK